MRAELTLALIEKGMPLDEAKAFVAAFLEANPQAAQPAQPARRDEDGPSAFEDPAAAIPSVGQTLGGLPIPGVSQSELKTLQDAAALRVGRTLCPNCQQATPTHLPGCARASQENPRAVTKGALPPVSR